MATVVLLGFSTAGKSTIARELQRRHPSIEVVDTDKLVAGGSDEHIYDVYLSLVRGRDRGPAIDYIQTKERSVVRDLQRTATPGRPRLVAAGPAVVSRDPEWAEYFAAIGPVCYCLEVTREEVYLGLLERRGRHLKQLTENGVKPIPEGFGCWDEDVTTAYQDGAWVLLPKGEALDNIDKHMHWSGCRLVPTYRDCVNKSGGTACRARDLRTDATKREELYVRIAKDLDVIQSSPLLEDAPGEEVRAEAPESV